MWILWALKSKHPADQITPWRPFFEQKEVLFYSHTVNILRKKETSKARTYAYVFRMYTENNHLNLHIALRFSSDLIYMITFDGYYIIDFSWYHFWGHRGSENSIPNNKQISWPHITVFFYSISAHTTEGASWVSAQNLPLPRHLFIKT